MVGFVSLDPYAPSELRDSSNELIHKKTLPNSYVSQFFVVEGLILYDFLIFSMIFLLEPMIFPWFSIYRGFFLYFSMRQSQDSDGSVGLAAVLPPRQPSSGARPVLVSLSGVGVEPQGQADAYKMKHREEDTVVTGGKMVEVGIKIRDEGIDRFDDETWRLCLNNIYLTICISLCIYIIYIHIYIYM